MQDITFNGLTSVLKGNIYTTPSINKLALVFPNSSGNVGCVPSEWLRNIPRSERKSFIEELYKIFSDIVKLQRTKFIGANRKSSKILNEFLAGKGVINQNEKVKFSYCGYGSFANVVKFNVNKKKYALKIFLQENMLENIKKEFGNCAEQNNALYINADENSDWTKFYFGNILDKYMITKYIDDNTPKPRKKIKLSDKGVEFLDYDYANIKLNTNIDYGGFRKLRDFPVGNKVAMWTIKKLKNLSPEKRAEEIKKITENKKVPNYYDRMIGVKYVENHVIPKDKEFDSTKHGFWHSLINAFLEFYGN